MRDESDEALFWKVVVGTDSDIALRQLMDKHDGTVAQATATLDPWEQEDAHCDSWSKAWETRMRFDATQPFGGWMYCLARNVARNTRRDRRRRAGLLKPLDHATAIDFADSELRPDADVYWLRQDLLAVISGLPNKEVASFLQVLLDCKCDYRATAKRLGVRPETVRKRLRQHSRHLRRALSDIREL